MSMEKSRSFKVEVPSGSEREIPEGETYDVTRIKAFLKQLDENPKKLERFREMALNRAKDIFESGGLDKEFKKGDKVLYAGVGAGHVPQYIESQKGIKMFKLDLEDIRTPDVKEDEVRFVRATVRRLPFKDESLDTICLFDILHHTKNQPEILDEVKRVLRPSGKCLILEDTIPESFVRGSEIMRKIVGKVDDLFSRQPKGVNPHNYHSISDWELMFSNKGFKPVDTKSWYWGLSDFMPEAIKPKRSGKRTVARPFESTLFKIIKEETKSE